MQRPSLSLSPLVLSSLLAAGLAACGTPRLVPLAPVGEAPQEGVAVRASGLALTSVPADWPGYPGDLPRSVTPLLLVLANEAGAPVLVRFEDFLLLDSGDREYRVLSPLEVVTVLYGSAPSRSDILPAFHLHRHPFFFHGLLSDPFFYPYSYPYHPYYPYDAPAPYAWPPGRDILRLALREGRVLPGHRVEGFLFFQHATAGAGPFTLSWIPRDPETGQALATLRLPLGLRT
ncbi:MAG: hypothetical protein HYY89_05200 [candidate division NC10 bacterium]|nr:hypothetical protein [candidate division NC10 bacterium]